jgi:Na+/melibiose symporter-like transporter
MVEAISDKHSLLVHRARLRTGMRASTMEGMLATPIVTMSLPVNIFITALVTKGFPLTKPAIGSLTSLPFVCNFLQAFYSPFVARWLPVKFTATTMAAIHTGCWLWLGWKLPSLPLADPLALAKFLLPWFFVSSVFNASLAVAWNSWMHDLVPPRMRGRYFGQRNRYCQGATLVFVLLTGWVLSLGGYSVRIFQIVIGTACLFRAISLYFFWRMPGTRPAAPQPAVAALPFAEQVRHVSRAHSLLLFIGFGAIWSFATNCFGPFYYVFMYEELGFTGTQVGILATLTALGGMLSLPVWGQLLDRYGNKAVMAVALGLWQLQNFFWCILTPANSSLLYLMWLVGGSWSAGFVLGQLTILLKLIPPEAKNLAIGLNLAFISMVAAVSPIIGGQVLAWAIAQGHAPLSVYHAAFLLQPVMCLLGCLLLVKLREPAASEFTIVVGAMRNIRTLSGVMGLSFLVNYLFVKPGRRGR